MHVFINLPIKDVQRSRAFFKNLDFSFNETFSNEQALCVILNDFCHVMMLDENYFKTFTPRQIANAHQSTELLTAIGLDNRAAVDQMMKAAVAGGGVEVRDPQDHGFMYTRAFADLDGHIWEVCYFDQAEFAKMQDAGQ